MIKNILKDRKVNYICTILLLVLCPALCIYLSNYILRQGLVVTLKYILPRWKIAGIGYILMLLVSTVITFVTRKVALAYLVTGGISVFGAAAHFFKTTFRGEALFPSDIVFATAAGDMVSQFNISLTEAMIVSLVILVTAVVFSSLFTLPEIKNKYYINVIVAAVFSLATAFYWNNYILDTQYYKNMGFYENMNPVDIYYSNTFHTAFLFYVNSTMVFEPEDYSQKQVDRMLSEAETVSEQTTPDVILILLESYFDPNNLFGLEFTESINENYNSIAQKAIYGNMLSFKYGGGTADIEFNILNQINTTYFTEALSYMNVYGNDKLPSFVQDLKADDYSTYAMHAYTSQLYNRINAYKNMGFDGSKFVDTYSNTDTYGNYVSDISHVDEMIKKYEEYVATGAENIFLYGVSMQNHMYMSQENIDSDRVYLADTGYSQSFTDGMGILASYMRQTDMAIKRLYDYFEQVDREVVIILYGDHQSYNIDGLSDFTSESLNEIPAYNSMTDKEKYIASHTTPFIMWSNKQDKGGEYWPLVSPYNLWALASQSFGLPSGEYERYLYQQMQTMPVNNGYAGIWCDRNGKIYEEKPEEISDSIMLLNYDRLFGKQYSVGIQESEV